VITVVDYGMGNLRNVRRAFEAIGQEVLVTSDPAAVRSAHHLVLPGVGAFGEAVKRIDALDLRSPILDHVGAGKPLLGICLGMQLLFETSEESPGARGLGVMPGEVIRFGDGVKVPHIGWNDVRPVPGGVLLESLPSDPCFYFVHSYYVPETPAQAGWTSHGVEFVSAVAAGSVRAFQFHPEKSQSAGLELLRRFAGGGQVNGGSGPDGFAAGSVT
jgi:imidazole glycerol phosphate synthase glutamine amidotransferase subunit